MLSNRMTLDALVDGKPDQMALLLSAEELAMLSDDLEAEKERVKKYGEAMSAVLTAKYSQKAADDREDDYGTARVDDGEFVAVSNVPKKVDWDQKKLAAKVALIRAAGDKPEDYVKIEYSIEEKKWNAWPDTIKAQFLEARSTKPGKETIKLEKKK